MKTGNRLGALCLGLGVWLMMGAWGCAHSKARDAGLALQNRGNVDGAIEYYALALEKKPEYADGQVALSAALQASYQQHRGEADRLVAGKKYLEAIAHYDRILDLNAVAGRCPGGMPRDAAAGADRQRVATEAATFYYGEGDRLYGDADFKQAAYCFRSCMALDAGYQDAKDRYDRAKSKATQTIAIVGGATKESLKEDSETLANELHKVVRERQPEFLKFIHRRDMEDLAQQQKVEHSGSHDERAINELGKALGIAYMTYVNVKESESKDTGWVKDREEEKVKVVDKTATRQKVVTNPDGSQRTEVETYNTGEKITYKCTVTFFSRTVSARVSADYRIANVTTFADETGADNPTWTAERSEKRIYNQVSGDHQNALTMLEAYELNKTREKVEPPDPSTLLSSANVEVVQKLAEKLMSRFR